MAAPAGPVSIAVDASGELWITSLTGAVYARDGLGWVYQLGDSDSIAPGDGAIWALNAYGQASQLTELVQRVHLRNQA